MTRILLYFIALMLMDHVGMPAWAIVCVAVVGVLHSVAGVVVDIVNGMTQP